MVATASVTTAGDNGDTVEEIGDTVEEIGGMAEEMEGTVLRSPTAAATE